MDTAIHFEVKTQKPFAGRIFVKGKVLEKECVKSDYASQKTTSPGIDLQFGNCGMRGLRTVRIILHILGSLSHGIQLSVSFFIRPNHKA